MSEKEVDYGRMLTGLSMGISALYQHENALKALRTQLSAMIVEIDAFIASAPGKEAHAWYEAISKEHDAEIRARYESQFAAVGGIKEKE